MCTYFFSPICLADPLADVFWNPHTVCHHQHAQHIQQQHQQQQGLKEGRRLRTVYGWNGSAHERLKSETAISKWTVGLMFKERLEKKTLIILFKRCSGNKRKTDCAVGTGKGFLSLIPIFCNYYRSKFQEPHLTRIARSCIRPIFAMFNLDRFLPSLIWPDFCHVKFF